MNLAIYGTNGTGKEVYDLAMRLGTWDEIVFLDDFSEKDKIFDSKCMPFSELINTYKSSEIEICIAIGEPAAKEMLYGRIKEAGYELANVISEDAIISPSAKLGKGIIIKYQVIISAEAIIEDNVFIQSNVIISHNSLIKKHCQISSFSHIAGNTTLDECVYVGIHCPLREMITVGRYAIISMGAVVQKDVPEEAIVMGNPARIYGKNDIHKIFGR